MENTPYTLTATEIDAVIGAFGESDDVIGHRVFTVGNLTTEYEITPKEVFAQVNAHLELSAGQTNARPVKGWSASSIANAKTAFDLYASTGVSLTKGTKGRRYAFAALVEDVRRAHGAKTVKTVIKDALALIEDGIDQDSRHTYFTDVLTALKGKESEKAEKAPATPEDRFLSALRAAVKLAGDVELTEDQATEAQNLIAELASLGI